MNNYFQHIPFGSSLPIENPHAVSVSFPLLQNVIDYEEGVESAITQMESGYPRFFQNKLVQKLVAFIRNKYHIASTKVILPIVSTHAKIILEELIDTQFEFVEEDENIFLILENSPEFIKKCTDTIRNIGLLISSRKAESTLCKLNQSTTFFEEEKNTIDPDKQIKNTLSNAYFGNSEENILLTNSGMNALFSAYKTVVEVQKPFGKNKVIQLGWLYVDTMEIIAKQSENSHIQINIHNKTQLEDWLEKNHTSAAVLITEVVTNPLIQCIDLPWIASLCKKYNIVLIVDATMATPFNVKVLPYCDIVVESLTKFACGSGDLLMGALILNDKSDIIQLCKNQFEKYIIPAFSGETQRLAFQIQDYKERVRKVSENTVKLLKYLKKQSFIKEIYSVEPSKIMLKLEPLKMLYQEYYQ